jgi:hypothetical protein
MSSPLPSVKIFFSAVSSGVKLIRARIRLTTTLSQTHEGTLFAADSSQDLLAIRETQAQGQSVHIIPLSQISSFKILAPAADNDQDGFVGGKVDVEALKQREQKAVMEAKKAEANVGRGVTKEAQEIFDHISRTYVTLSSFPYLQLYTS